MKNKKYKLFLSILIILIIFIVIFYFINDKYYKKYNKNYNIKLNQIISNIHEKYNIDITEIIDIISNDNTNNYLYKYGYDIDESIIKINSSLYFKYMSINIIYVSVFIIVIIMYFYLYNRFQNKKINEIINYIEEIRKKNYQIKIDDNIEDDLSILKNELYKITIMLKEESLLAKKDKNELKKSLEDISHQIKTPLTSILIILDNIIENPTMDYKIRNDFISDIKREIININYLVQSLLKLSKFDTNTITYNKTDELVSDIVFGAYKNISILCEVKNIKINIINNNDSIINCDLKWEIEAISNILKNCIEYSYLNDSIEVIIDSNKAYSSIEIIDHGKGIDKKDINHIFERFYKGSSNNNESIGIGLALAKNIILKDNGSINVESLDKGTKFVIKYFKI